jgi:hypothetical protein
MGNEWQVGDPTLLSGSPSWGSAPSDSSNPYGYGSGVALGVSVTTETVIPGVNANPGAGADQTADFNRYLGMVGQALSLINPFTAQYQNEQNIRLTEQQTALQNAKNAGQYVPPKQDNTVLIVVGGVAALGLLVFVFKDKG